MSQRKLYSKQLVADTVAAIKTSGSSLLPLALSYLQSANSIVPYEEPFKVLLEQSSSEKTLALVESLYKYEAPPYELVMVVSQHLHAFESYQEVHRFLSYVEHHDLSNTQLLENIARLLDHPKFSFLVERISFARASTFRRIAKESKSLFRILCRASVNVFRNSLS